MLQTDYLESAIRQELARVGTCTLEELNERLPYYPWNQVFSAVDRLNREGTVTLQRPDSSDYLLSLAPRRSAQARHVTPV
jgi:hypothetical protein